VADALEANEAAILAENAADMAAAEAAGTEEALLNRLKMKDGKLAQLAQGIRFLADMDEPIGKVLRSTKVPTPFGLISLPHTATAQVVDVLARPNHRHIATRSSPGFHRHARCGESTAACARLGNSMPTKTSVPGRPNHVPITPASPSAQARNILLGSTAATHGGKPAAVACHGDLMPAKTRVVPL